MKQIIKSVLILFITYQLSKSDEKHFIWTLNEELNMVQMASELGPSSGLDRDDALLTAYLYKKNKPHPKQLSEPLDLRDVYKKSSFEIKEKNTYDPFLPRFHMAVYNKTNQKWYILILENTEMKRFKICEASIFFGEIFMASNYYKESSNAELVKLLNTIHLIELKPKPPKLKKLKAESDKPLTMKK